MIRINNIEKRFKKLHALQSISADMQKGQVIALIGPNGSGKTTLIKSILGLVKPDGGQIYFNNVAIDEKVDYRSNIGYMPQIGRYPDNMKIGQLFKMIRNIRQDEKHLDEELYYKFKLDTLLEKSMRSLSGGTRQKVSAALAFLFNPDVLILDEPTAGVDVELRQGLWRFIRQLNHDGHTIVLTTHYLEEAEALCGRVAMLKQGRIVALDTIRNLVNSVSGCAVQLRLLPDTLPPVLQPLLSSRENGYHVLLLDEYSQIEQVLAALRNAASQVLEMQVLQPDLEEVFVRLMGADTVKPGGAA